MDDLSEHYLGYTTTHFTDIAGKGKKQITFNQVSIDNGAPYACPIFPMLESSKITRNFDNTSSKFNCTGASK
jgi:DNA polymerase I-like protein with 3'-5' exonuclease and polymerase domains